MAILDGPLWRGYLLTCPLIRSLPASRPYSGNSARRTRGACSRRDFSDPKELTAAFAGATQVLVISVDKLGEPALKMHYAAIEAARTAGAQRILYTSHLGARADSPFAPASDHAATEAFLVDGSVPFTSLRHGFYAESAVKGWGDRCTRGRLSELDHAC